MSELYTLSLRNVGLLNLKSIEKLCPNVAVLDFKDNRIFTIEAVEILYKL